MGRSTTTKYTHWKTTTPKLLVPLNWMIIKTLRHVTQSLIWIVFYRFILFSGSPGGEADMGRQSQLTLA